MMKKLRFILFSIYVVIIILLLLGLRDCSSKGASTSPNPDADTILPEELPPIKETFKAEVVMCVDCTGSMMGILSTIKSNAVNFYDDLKRKCREQGKDISSMKIRVIGFRDYCDGLSLECSGFYNMPAQDSLFRAFINALKSDGGGDDPEIGYDALCAAMKSDWSNGADVHQVIILWTDAASHPVSAYSEPTTFAGMEALWNEKMHKKGKRLILFAPNHSSWTVLEKSWDKTVRHDVNFGAGISDVDYDEILKTLSETI